MRLPIPVLNSTDPTSDTSPSVRLVIPAFQESTRLGPFLDDLNRELQSMTNVTVQVVDDGSAAAEAEATAALINQRRSEMPWLLTMHGLSDNHGKGAAVRAGWDLAGDEAWLAFADADGATPAREIRRLIAQLPQASPGGPAIFASRILMLGRHVDRKLKRHIVGRVFATLVSNLLGIRAYDTQCGCKFIPAAAYHRIRDRLKCRGFSFDVELLVVLTDSGCQVREEPVDWFEIPGGKVHLIRDSWRMFRELLDIRARRRKSGD